MRGCSLLWACLLTMMQGLSFRCYCHSVKSSAQRLPALQGSRSSRLKKSFWGGGGKTRPPAKKQLKQSPQILEAPSVAPVSESSTGSDGKTLVAQFGDKTPKMSPILVLPLSRRPVFPGFFATHLVKDEKTLEAIIENHKNGISYLGLFLRKDKDRSLDERQEEDSGGSDAVITSLDQVYSTGTYAQIHNVIKTARGGQLLLMAHRRIRLDSLLPPPAPPHPNASNSTSTSTSGGFAPALGRVTFLTVPTPDHKSAAVKAYANEIIAAVREIVKLNPVAQEHIHEWASRMDFSDPLRLADFAASLTTAEGDELQRALSATDPEERLSIVLELLHKEKKIAEFQQELSQQVEEKMSQHQREFMLREQLKAIQKELDMGSKNGMGGGGQDEKAVLVAKYQGRVDALRAGAKAQAALGSEGLPSSSTLQVMQDEVDRLGGLERSSPEYGLVRAYLDWLTALPYHTYSRDELNLTRARAVLEADHLGLQDVKRQILEFIAVGRLKQEQHVQDQMRPDQQPSAVTGEGDASSVRRTGTDSCNISTSGDNGSSSGITSKVLCLIGPPGVGKTSIAKSIATALNRKFHRFSVGGLTDMAEIKGHRRTYIGAMPGKPVQILKTLGTANPVILIDEIDKLGRGVHGDPASALLELLDASQNNSFVDHYLDIPVDFSRVLFVCTANDEGAIPPPLRDRMDMMRLSGYDLPEKVEIAKRYLVPKIFRAMGLWRREGGENRVMETGVQAEENVALPSPPFAAPSAKGVEKRKRSCAQQLSISDAALEALVRDYSRESGIRSLQKHLEKIARKIAYQEVTRQEEEAKTRNGVEEGIGETPGAAKSEEDNSSSPYLVTPERLEEFLGVPKYSSECLYSSEEGQLLPLPPGVAMGLAWNPQGGTPVFVEAVATPVAFSDKGGSVEVVTGQLGDVMRESVNIAYTFARQFVRGVDPDNEFFQTHQLHLHCPEGAVGKDGPSAGITIATALISLATQTPVLYQLAMTGELSLTGKVLAVGGVKEKILAARRSGARKVILPSACRRDFQALPEYVREALQVHFASSFDDVFRVAFSKGRNAAGTSAVADTAEDGKKMEATRERMGMDAGLGIRVRMDGHVAEKEMELPSLLPHQQWQ